MPRDQIIKHSANKDKIQNVRDLNFDKELQLKNEINRLKARKDEELEHLILRNKHLRRSEKDGEEELIDEVDELITKKVNELKNLFAADNDLIDLLLWLDETMKDLKTKLKHADI